MRPMGGGLGAPLGERDRARTALAIALTVAVTVSAEAGCSVVYPYPEGESAERGTACSNGRDDDFDGAVDCDDRDCVGFCPEVEHGACVDRLDNDGDGAVDADDPGCWSSFAHLPEMTLCTSTSPMDIVEPFPVLPGNAPLGGPYLLRGRSSFPPWDTGDRSDYRWEVHDSSAELVSRFVLPRDAQFVASAAVGVPTDASLRLLFVPAPSAEFTGVTIDDAQLGLELVTTAEQTTIAIAALGERSSAAAPPGPWQLTLDAGAATVTARLDGLDGQQTELAVARPPGMGSGVLILQLTAVGITPDAAFVDDLRLQAWGVAPCGSTATPLFTDDASACPSDVRRTTAHVGRQLAVSAAGPQEICGVFSRTDDEAGTVEVFAAKSSDAGRSFWPTGTVTPLAPDDTLNGVAVGRDGDSWRAVLGIHHGDQTALYTFASPDCARWSDLGAESAGGAFAPSLVARDGTSSDLYYFRPGVALDEYVLHRSEDGLHVRADDPSIGVVGPELALSFPVTLTRMAGDLALVYPTRDAAGLALAVWDFARDSSPQLAKAPLLAPDPNAAELSLGAGALVATAEQTVLVYSARGRPLGSSWPLSAADGTYVHSATLAIDSPESPVAVPPTRCGDDRCQAPTETCESCADDCCSVVRARPEVPSSGSHWSAGLERAVLSPSIPLSWPLDAPLDGDFTLRLRLELRMTTTATSGRFVFQLRNSEDVGPAIVGRLRRDCGVDTYAVSVVSEEHLLDGATEDCDTPSLLLVRAPILELELTRSANDFRLRANDAEGCASAEQSLETNLPDGSVEGGYVALRMLEDDAEVVLLVDAPWIR
jgi:hypothetical protein